ncbi:MAG: hypothetical protein ACYCU7_08735 [Acidimicrobiales bacterium]
MSHSQALRDLRALEPELARQGESQLPEPLLPADQKVAWITAWNTMASCMHSHGEPGFPVAPSTFGDGRTPPPLVSGSPGSSADPASATFQAAQAACPFDTSGLSTTVLQQAQQAWLSGHRGGPQTGVSTAVRRAEEGAASQAARQAAAHAVAQAAAAAAEQHS